MSTSNPSTFQPGGIQWYACPPDQFAAFKRGDKALCLTDFGRSDWCDNPPRKGRVYVVRDYHFGTCATNVLSVTVYGQILNLEGVVADHVPMVPGAEWGWHFSHFRKVTEEEATEVARAAVGAGQSVEASTQQP